MFTGWYNNDMSFDQMGVWRYFGESGSNPMTSRLGRMCRYGQVQCLGNNGQKNMYFFSSTGGMFIGTNSLGTFNSAGSDPETDMLGALMK